MYNINKIKPFVFPREFKYLKEQYPSRAHDLFYFFPVRITNSYEYTIEIISLSSLFLTNLRFLKETKQRICNV